MAAIKTMAVSMTRRGLPQKKALGSHRGGPERVMEQLFGGNPLAVLIKLAVICVIVGIVLNVLGVDPTDLFARHSRYSCARYRNSAGAGWSGCSASSCWARSS